MANDNIQPKKGGNTLIKNATILVTDRCNSKCRMCNIWNSKQKSYEMKPEEYKIMFGREEFKYLDDINISGGEALLREDIGDVVEAIMYERNVEMFFLSTNGTNPDKALEVAKIAQQHSKKVYIAISIDGDKEINKCVRGIDSYDLAVKTINVCKDYDSNLITNISLTLTPLNTTQYVLEHIKKLAIETGSTYSFRFAYNNSTYFKNSEKVFKYEEEQRMMVADFIESNLLDDPFMVEQMKYIRTGKMDIIGDKESGIKCLAGNKFVLVRPNGDIYPCINSERCIGNMKYGIIQKEINDLGKYELCPCCMECCVWPLISWK